jgi:predicted helicase
LEKDHNQTWLWQNIPEFELRKSKLLGNWNEHRLVKKDNKINGIPDLGADILLKDNEKYILIQCKNFDSNNVTIHHLAGFYAMTLHYEMEGIVYYTSNISPNIRLLKPRSDIHYIKQEMPNNEISLQLPQTQSLNKLIDKPYYYQIEAYNQLKDLNRSILSLPCGMGKTLIAIMIAKNYDNIVLLSPLIAYSKQNLERFQTELQSMNYQLIIVNSEGTRDSKEILKKL